MSTASESRHGAIEGDCKKQVRELQSTFEDILQPEYLLQVGLQLPCTPGVAIAIILAIALFLLPGAVLIGAFLRVI